MPCPSWHGDQFAQHDQFSIFILEANKRSRIFHIGALSHREYGQP